MVREGLTALTGKTNETEAWLSMVNPEDVVGIKVFSAPGPDIGTRPVVVEAVVEGLKEAGIPAEQIVVWDKRASALRRAGFFEFTHRLGIRVMAGELAGYDEEAFYETPLVGTPAFGDREFGREGDGVGRKSYFTKLVTGDVTRIISIAPLLNHPEAGVTGTLFSLAMGSVDNTRRFEVSAGELSRAVPEVYADPQIYDKAILHITDALICQYEGEQKAWLHHAAQVNELWFGRDPVALDLKALQELEARRRQAGASERNVNRELYENAALLQLGTADPAGVQVERVRQAGGTSGL
jgi:hypothetical protein